MWEELRWILLPLSLLVLGGLAESWRTREETRALLEVIATAEGVVETPAKVEAVNP